MASIAVRLIVATAFGGVLGLQRAHVGKAAGMQTHMLVTLGAAIVVLCRISPGCPVGSSRIIQETLTGIGSIGGGVILKMNDKIRSWESRPRRASG